MRHLKRLRLGEDIQMLAVPRYEKKVVTVKELDPKVSKKRLVKVQKEQLVLKEFLAVVYKNEDRVLTDVIYQFKEIKEFPTSI